MQRATRFALNLCNFQPLGIRWQLRNNRFRPDKMRKVDGIFVETHLNVAISLLFDNSRTCTRYLIKIPCLVGSKIFLLRFVEKERLPFRTVDNQIFCNITTTLRMFARNKIYIRIIRISCTSFAYYSVDFFYIFTFFVNA